MLVSENAIDMESGSSTDGFVCQRPVLFSRASLYDMHRRLTHDWWFGVVSRSRTPSAGEDEGEGIAWVPLFFSDFPHMDV